MADTPEKLDIYYTVQEETDHPGWYGVYATADEAMAKARQKAWNNGEDHHVMKTVAIARAPEQINTVKVETIS